MAEHLERKFSRAKAEQHLVMLRRYVKTRPTLNFVIGDIVQSLCDFQHKAGPDTFWIKKGDLFVVNEVYLGDPVKLILSSGYNDPRFLELGGYFTIHSRAPSLSEFADALQRIERT